MLQKHSSQMAVNYWNRKLKIEDVELQNIVSLSNLPPDFIYAPPLQESTGGSSSRIQSSNPNPGFESSMALTIFVLLTALFFMGFFTVYFHCVGSDRRSRSTANFINNSRLQQLAAASWNNPASKNDNQGLDPNIIGSLPTLPYIMSNRRADGRLESENGDDCVVCLCEYEEGEMVKLIPNCGHLFHPECIDLWFISHSSCPLCRSTRLFRPSPAPEKKKKQQQEEEEEEKQEDYEFKSMVVKLRRAFSFSNSSSSSLLGVGDDERFVVLKRSSSWSYYRS